MKLLEILEKNIDPIRADIIEKALRGVDLNIEEIELLLKSKGADLLALALAADYLRKIQVGDMVTYVVNRNINYTNICALSCSFCAFGRSINSLEAYMMPLDEIVRMAEEAWKLGATEVCIQGGLPPKMDWEIYPRILKAIKSKVPNIHIHAFSPQEIWYGSKLSGLSYKEFLKILKEEGLDSIPGTSAEILDDRIRKDISPGRLSSLEWIEIIKEAHRLGIPSTSTIMYGHVEDYKDRAKHLAILREIEKDSPGFTEFVPLSFVPYNTVLYKSGKVKKNLTIEEIMALYATSRLVLGKYIKNIQVSWVKEGPKLAQTLLHYGANDFGGTLINESISTKAGATSGQFLSPRTIRKLILETNRIPAQRTTTYKILKVFDSEIDPNPIPLEIVDYSPEIFGSYDIFAKKWKFSKK